VRFSPTVPSSVGLNDYGELGSGNFVTAFTAVPVVGVTHAVAISTGLYHSCALLSGVTLQCWGENGSGQLGSGTTVTSPSAVTVSTPPLSNPAAIAPGVIPYLCPFRRSRFLLGG